MTEVKKEDIKKIAKLSRLSFDEENLENFSKDVSNIISWVEDLNELDTDNVEPMMCVENKLRQRDDIAEEEAKTEIVLKNSCDRQYDFYAVPKVIE